MSNSLIFKSLVGVIGWIFLVFMFIDGFFTVQPWIRAFILTNGKPWDTVYSEGLHFKIPFFQSVVKTDTKIQKITLKADAASKDQQQIVIDLAVNYNLNQSDVIKIFSSIGDLKSVEDKIISPKAYDIVKRNTSQHTAEEMLTMRGEIGVQMKKELAEFVKGYWISLSEVNLVNVAYGKKYTDAIEDKAIAEQKALTEKNNLEAVKFKAQQEIETAKGNAEAIRITSEAIEKSGGDNYIKLKYIEKWNGMESLVKWGNGIINLSSEVLNTILKPTETK